MRMASVPRPMPVTFTSGRAICAPAASSFAKPSSEARITAAAPSDMTQMSSRVSGQATIGALRTSWMVMRWLFCAYGIVEGVDVVLHADVRHLLDGRAELLHVAGDHHGVVAGIENLRRGSRTTRRRPGR